MKSRGETETNHPRFWKSFRTDDLPKLIGGEKGLIFVGSAATDALSVFICVGQGKKKEKKNE